MATYARVPLMFLLTAFAVEFGLVFWVNMDIAQAILDDSSAYVSAWFVTALGVAFGWQSNGKEGDKVILVATALFSLITMALFTAPQFIFGAVVGVCGRALGDKRALRSSAVIALAVFLALMTAFSGIALPFDNDSDRVFAIAYKDGSVRVESGGFYVNPYEMLSVRSVTRVETSGRWEGSFGETDESSATWSVKVRWQAGAGDADQRLKDARGANAFPRHFTESLAKIDWQGPDPQSVQSIVRIMISSSSTLALGDVPEGAPKLDVEMWRRVDNLKLE